MRTTTYKCDKCGNEDQDNKTLKLERVGVHVGDYNRTSNYVKTKVEYNQEWCIDCREKAGLAIPEKDKKVEVVPVTLEDLVRDIAYKSAEEYAQNN